MTKEEFAQYVEEVKAKTQTMTLEQLSAFEFVVWTLMKEALNGKGFDQH